MRRFYFTNEEGANIADDYIGNIRGAIKIAQKIADESNETITINDCNTDEMIEFIYPN